MTRQPDETREGFIEAAERGIEIDRFHFARMWPKRHTANVRGSIRANIRGQRNTRRNIAAVSQPRREEA
jgi:hypothetical protein